MNNYNQKIKVINLFAIAILTLIIITPSAIADWTQIYCNYNGGAGSSVCDSGEVAGDIATCDPSNKCAEEGTIVCTAKSDFTIGGSQTFGPLFTEDINWDNDANDCSCKIGVGKWALGGEVAATSCCGDDANEYSKTESSSTDAPAGYNDGITTCCDSNTDCTYNDVCTTSGGVSSPAIPNKAYCFSGIWYGGDYSSTACTTTAGPGKWALGGEVATTSCCGDDSGENYIGPNNGRSCDGTTACCDSASDYVNNGICVPACYRWENLFGDKITGANKGDTVGAVLRNTGLADGNTVTFEIYEGGDAIKTGADAIIETSKDGNVIAYWTITSEDLDKTSTLNNFFFKTDFSADASDSLNISQTYDNSLTSINIITPACGIHINAGPGTVDIEINAQDDDDILEGTLSVNGAKIGTFKNGNTKIDHVFASGGNYKIIAEATSSRGKKKRVISNIMVIDPNVDGEYVAACITKPEDYSNIPTSYVEFDASDSKGVRHQAGGTTTGININELKFNWLFSDGRTNPYINGTNQLSYKFFKNFKAVGNNWATLQVSII